MLEWRALALYPAGYAVSGIRIQPSVRLLVGWKFASGLDGARTGGGYRLARTDTPAALSKASDDLDK